MRIANCTATAACRTDSDSATADCARCSTTSSNELRPRQPADPAIRRSGEGICPLTVIDTVTVGLRSISSRYVARGHTLPILDR